MNFVFDIGATKLRVAAEKNKQIGEPRVAETPQDFGEAMALLCDFLTREAAGESVRAIAGGTPGDIADGRITGDIPYLPRWTGGDIAGAIREKIPGAEVRVFNDGEVAALGEARTGAGRGYSRVAYVGIGTGIGGALCIDGMLEPRDFKVGKQNVGGKTLEERVGGRGILKEYGHGWDKLDPQEYARALGMLSEGLRQAAEHWKPDIIVLGGGIPFFKESFLEDVAKEIPEFRLTRAFHGELSGLWGALELLPLEAH